MSSQRIETSSYIIRGGIEGRQRLRILSRIMRASTLELLGKVGIRPGMACLEVACGSGDLAFDMAGLVTPGGKVVATDIDRTKLELAIIEAKARELTNVEFRFADIAKDVLEQEFDLVHARFILTHLPNPEQALKVMRQALRPGGVLVVEDVDFRGYFCYPECGALWRYVELYSRTVQQRGGDPYIGPRLPSLLAEAGFDAIQMNVVQPAGMAGEVKLLSPLTMENIADAVMAEGLASREEIDRLVAQLYEFARTPGTIGCTPRVVQAWGTSGKS